MEQQNHPPKGLFTTCLLILLFWGISEARFFLIPISISALLALMMLPLVNFMRKYRFPEWSAIGAAAILLILPFLVMIYGLILQGQSLVQDFPQITASLHSAIVEIGKSDFGRKLHLFQKVDLGAVTQDLIGGFSQSVQIVLTSLGAILGAGSQLALVLLFSIVMLASRSQLRRSSEKILKQNFSIRDPKMIDEVISLIEKFLLARLLIVIIVGTVDTLILRLFGIPYAFLLGSVSGVMTLIPAIGFFIGVAPIILVALTTRQSLIQTIVMLAILVAISIFEGNYLTPQMVGRKLNINPLATFIGFFAGGLLWGVWGMFLSIPALGILRITFSASPTLKAWGELFADKDLSS